MDPDVVIAASTEIRSPSLRRALRLTAYAFAATAIAALALAVRWHHITAPPLDFALARQYHSYNIAREFYLDISKPVPAWERRIARANYHEEPPLEPPIFEAVNAGVYRIVGGERLWVPRLLSSLLWITGGLLLFRLATRLCSRWAALLTTGVYLFFPFPLVASTSFQPDPLMVTLLIASALMIVRHHERPTAKRLLAAAGMSAAAIFVKPGIAAFFLLPLFAALAFVREGTRGAFTRADFYGFPILSCAPTAGLYVYSVIANRFLAREPSQKINPELLRQAFYWHGWFDIVKSVLRPPLLGPRASLLVLGISVAAIFLARSSTAKAILGALWAGYIVFGLVVSNHISSHDYYSLPLIPICALSLGSAAEFAGTQLRPALRRPRLRAALLAVLLATAAAGAAKKATHASVPNVDPSFAQQVSEFETIGRLVHHTSRALALDPSGLWFHGWVAGRYWPDHGDLLWETRNDGLRPMNADARFVTTDPHRWPAVGTMKPPPTVFIVLNPKELVLQPDLAVHLSDFRVMSDTPDYLVFDLTRRANAGARRLGPDAAPDTAPTGSGLIHRFPPSWHKIERGLTERDVARLLGRPARIQRVRGLRKPLQNWFYGPNEQYAIVFVDGRVFATIAS